MGRVMVNAPFVVFNGGEIGPETLDRVTLDNYASCAETLENIWVDANGPMTLRPGFGFQAQIDTNQVRLHPFIRSITEKFILVLGDSTLRIAVPGNPADIIARGAVASSITNGNFGSGLSGWTNLSDTGSSVAASSGLLLLNADGINVARLRQAVTTASVGAMHVLNIMVHHGPVDFMCGSTSGGNEYISMLASSGTALRTGSHSLAFTPTGNFYIQFQSSIQMQVEVTSIQIAGAGDMVLATPWPVAMQQSLRFEQSSNVMYAWSDGSVQQRRIERWDNNSWSVSLTDERDGPFGDTNTDSTFTVTPTVRVGNGSLTSSKPLFKPTHVGALWKLVQGGEFQTTNVNAGDQWTQPILVQGVSGTRAITVVVATTTFRGTIRLQQSVGNTTSWVDAASNTNASVAPVTSGTPSATVTAASLSFAFNDGTNNQSIYYRAGCKAGDYTSGTATVSIQFEGSSTEGVVRITNYVSPQQVAVETLATMATATATNTWAEGAWSDYRGWPRCGVTFDGRLWSARDDKFWGSYSDAYESYALGTTATNTAGHSDSISRIVAVGQANTVEWMAGLSRLILGTAGSEVVIRADALDSPITTTNMTVRELSTFGVADVTPLKIDTRALYIDVSGFHLMEMVYEPRIQDYVARPLTALHRNVGRPGLTQMAAVRRPDTRVAIVRGDGQLLIKLFDPDENVLGWARFTTPGGVIESVCAMPNASDNQDDLYVSVARTVGGSTVRNLEKLGPLYLTSSAVACCLDSYTAQAFASPSATVTGLARFNGQSVAVWGDGADLGDFAVLGASITLPKTVRYVVVGLRYQGLYQSTKLAFGAKEGTALSQISRPSKLTFSVRDTVVGGIEYGQNFERMDRVADRMISDNFDAGPAWMTETLDPLTVPGETSRDSRICLRLSGPGPVTINGFVIGQELTEKVT